MGILSGCGASHSIKFKACDASGFDLKYDKDTDCLSLKGTEVSPIQCIDLQPIAVQETRTLGPEYVLFRNGPLYYLFIQNAENLYAIKPRRGQEASLRSIRLPLPEKKALLRAPSRLECCPDGTLLLGKDAAGSAMLSSPLKLDSSGHVRLLDIDAANCN